MLKIKILLSALVFGFLLTFFDETNVRRVQASKLTASTAQEVAGTRFKGQIANSKFEMILWRDGKSLRGNYYYLKTGSNNSLDLRGTIDEEGAFTLQEFDRNGKQTGEFTGFWKDDPNQSGAGLEGEWKKPGVKEGTAFSAAEQTINFTNGVKISTVTSSETFKAKRLEVSAAHPELIGGSAANIAGFNQTVKTTVTKKLADFKKLMLAQTAEDLKLLPENVNNYLDTGFNVEYANNNLISVIFQESTFTGGAHPNTSFFTINYDLKNGKELRLADLFKPGANYLSVISAYCVKDLQSRTDGGENLGLAQDLWENGAKPTEENYKSWNTTRKGIMVTFPQYQVGPYVAGPQFVIIPHSELKDILKADGALAKIAK